MLEHILQRSWDEYRANFRRFFLFILIFFGIPFLIITLVTNIWTLSDPSLRETLLNPNPNEVVNLFNVSPLYFVSMSILGIVLIMFILFIYSALISASVSTDKKAYNSLARFGRTTFWRFLGFCIVTGIFLTLLYLLLIIPGIIFTVFWSAAAYIFFTEQTSIFASLSTSFQLVRGRWWRTFGCIIVFFLILGGISLAGSLLMLPTGIPILLANLQGTGISISLFIVNSILGVIVKTVMSSITLPIGVLFLKHLYLELKSS
ncbi:hypothetical protein HYZ97_00305 [Candidatus Pacearchaeota archaeon]|nr:hypothetical protein [Candidatus Pacearchaeota archaeon]